MNRREFLGAMTVAPLAIGTQPAAWVPLPLGRPAPYQTDRGHTLGGNADRSRVVKLPGSHTAVTVADWVDSLDPGHFKYTITAREV